LALEPRLYARVQKSALRPLGDELDLTIPNFILKYYMDRNPTVDTSTRRTLSRRARSSRATSRILSATVDVPFATLTHLPT